MLRFMILLACSGLVFSQEDSEKAQIDIIKKAFEELGRDKKACIGAVMVGTILGMLGPDVTEEGLGKIVDGLDQAGFGELGFDDFMAMISKILSEEDLKKIQQELKEAFDQCDKEDFSKEE